MGKRNESGIKVKCKHCLHIWFTKSKKQITSCPRCSYRVRIEKNLTGEPINNFKPTIIKKSVYNKIKKAKARGGTIKPVYCEICHKKTNKLESHHVDYNKPLEVNWLCRKCHRNVDVNNITILNIHNIDICTTSIKVNSLDIFEMLYFKSL